MASNSGLCGRIDGVLSCCLVDALTFICWWRVMYKEVTGSMRETLESFICFVGVNLESLWILL